MSELKCNQAGSFSTKHLQLNKKNLWLYQNTKTIHHKMSLNSMSHKRYGHIGRNGSVSLKVPANHMCNEILTGVVSFELRASS